MIASEVAIAPHSDPDSPAARPPSEREPRPSPSEGVLRPRVAVLLSGSGRTLENLLAATRDGRLDAELVAVVASRPDVRGVAVARAAGLPLAVVERRGFADDAAFSGAIYGWLGPHRPHLIALAGFLKRLDVPPAWEGRILNVHPSLLSESAAAGRGFYGERVHAAVLASGAAESGATVHVVDGEYDRGPVVMERRVPVEPGDTVQTLAARVFAAECALYPAAIAAYLHDNPWLTAGEAGAPE